MTQEALKLALEALERSVATCFDQYAHQQVMSQPDHFINKAITALRLAIDVQNMASESTYKAALAQDETSSSVAAQQEPVAWMDIDEKGSASGLRYWSEPDNCHEVALYTTPPQRTWVGLTDEEVKTLRYKIDVTAHWTYDKFHEAIEAKLKEKNNGLL